MTEADRLYYNTQPKKNTSLSQAFNTLGVNNNTIPPANYSYAQGSAAGPLNLAQQQQSQKTGTAYIAPANNNTNTQNTTSTNPYDSLLNQMKSYYDKASVDNTQSKVDAIEKQKAADLQALKDSIAARTTDLDSQIANSRDKFQGYRDSADVQRAKNLQAVRELQAAQGIVGGDNITAQTSVNNEANQNISGIDQKEADYKTQLASQIAALKDSTTQQEAGIINKASADKLAAMDNEANRLSNVNSNYLSQLSNAIALKQGQDDKTLQAQKEYQSVQGMIYNPNTGKFEVDPNVAKAKTLSLIQGAKDDATRTGFYNPYAQYELSGNNLAEVNKYYGDLSGEINRRIQSPDKSDDALIPYLQNAKFQKVMSLPEQQRYSIGSDSGYLTQEGQKNYTDIQQKQVQTAGYQLDNLIKNTELAYKEPMLQAQLQKDLELIKKSQIENQYLPQEKISEINQRVAQAQAVIMNAQANVMDAGTKAWKAQKDYDVDVARLNQSKSQYDDKQLESSYKEIDDHITNFYTSVGDNSRTVISPQDKKDIGAYLDNLATKGTPVPVIKSLRAKYNLD